MLGVYALTDDWIENPKPIPVWSPMGENYANLMQPDNFYA